MAVRSSGRETRRDPKHRAQEGEQVRFRYGTVAGDDDVCVSVDEYQSLLTQMQAELEAFLARADEWLLSHVEEAVATSLGAKLRGYTLGGRP